MVFRFCVILLAALVLTEGSGVGDGITPSEENHFAPEFYWTRLGYNSFRLIWKTQQLVERGVEQIEVTVKPKHHRGQKVHMTVSVNNGEVVVEALEPVTLYAVIVKALRQGTVVTSYQTLFKTWPTGNSFACRKAQRKSQIIDSN
eukprot:TsM_001221200 transcript=TsM_001221200 gene=TsM_001221200